MTSCPNGHEVVAGQGFCGTCGAAVIPPPVPSPPVERGPLINREGRKWLLISLGIGVVVALLFIAGGKSTHGHPPEDDVTIDSCGGSSGFMGARLTITNHSSKRSSYIVSLNYEDASGTKLGEANAVSNNIEPGQASKEETSFLVDAAGGGRCVLKDVTRYAS